MRLGVIGLGSIAPFFLEAVAADPAWDLTAVCDLDEDKLAPYAGTGVAAFASYEELIGSGTVDAVVVTLPNDLHAPVIAAALERRVHVCCEKPLTVALEDARRLQQVSRRTGAVLFTAFHRRYNRHVGRLKEQLPEASAIGSVRLRYHEKIEEHMGSDQWYLDAERCGGGCVIDNGPNALDTARFLLGDLVTEDATIGDLRSGVEYWGELRLRAIDGGVPVTVELDWALPGGEAKDVEVSLKDGSVLRADMLEGFTGFKSSLAHEYEGILAAFRAAVDGGTAHGEDGTAVVALVEEAYRIARRKEARPRMPGPSKDPFAGRMVKLMYHSRDDRGMHLAQWGSRCVPAGEVHELVTTVESPQRPGEKVNRVGFLGFAVFDRSGVVEQGDAFFVEGRAVGTVVGFDECHAPNHYNILIRTERQLTAAELGLRVGSRVEFREKEGAS
ncbi:Gfo/Idh/MocA family oxidoreductase [Streptomyces sp. NPDC006235]|uniref:Gfo/Idh/MocA family protein n=1 Tax=Streptomyces sp. NPDC006235 TaxID=3156736 RepID=UPI0033AF65B4